MTIKSEEQLLLLYTLASHPQCTGKIRWSVDGLLKGRFQHYALVSSSAV